METSISSRRRLHWLPALDGAVWLALAVLVFFTIGRHEPWADEAQSWLLARDLPWFKLIFGELRYEGHPGLWHSILWIAIHWFHLPYGAMGYVGGGFAVAGLAVLLFHAPFPRPLRYLIASSFFLVYQYAVIARSYELLPLLAFGSACLFRKGIRHVIPFAVALSLMSHVSVHGATIAMALAIAFIVRLRPQWSGLEAGQKNQVMVAGAIFGFALVLLVVILFPPSATTVAMSDAKTFTLEAHVMKTFFGLCAAVTDYLPLALLILLLVGIWFAERHGLFLMLSAVGGTALIYGFLRGTRHHQGLILIALLTAIWAVWPTKEELACSPKASSHLHAVLVVTLSLLFAWHTYWSAVAIRNDWRGAYTGAQDAAMFLKSIHADSAGCNAYNFWLVGVQPYFDHNIFANLGGPDASAFYHQTTDFTNSIAGWPAFVNRKNNPPCMLFSFALNWRENIGPMVEYIKAQGYQLVHVSDGTAFFKDEPGERQLYLFFVRRPGIPEHLAQGAAQRGLD